MYTIQYYEVITKSELGFNAYALRNKEKHVFQHMINILLQKGKIISGHYPGSRKIFKN